MDKTDEYISHGSPIDLLCEQERRSSEQGSILDSEDDLLVGTDAQVFSSRKSVLSSDGSDSVFTGHCESPIDSPVNSGRQRIIKKLAHVGRLDSSDSLVSGLSDSSRNSHEVISLLNAMTVDPEEFLADLGFAEPDMRTRIPDRFLQSPSNAQGIDVVFFRRTLDQEDLHSSLSQDSPVWSDPGSSRIPLRFITSPKEPISPVFGEGHRSLPLISEPEEAPEDSFDLMRHLRLNKPCHVTKGMFLEPVTEELEVSSVGSGSIRTKISRKYSNEEGTIIVREESLEKPVVESELLLSVPVVENTEKGLGSNEFPETKVPRKIEDESSIFVTVEGVENTSVTGDREKSSEWGLVNYNDHSTEILQSDTSVADVIGKDGEETCVSLPCLTRLKVVSVVVQDSFELEEITTNEDFKEKELSFTDPEAGFIVKSSEKRLTRDNSGESSGFEEMLPDKETPSPGSSSPTLSVKRFSTDGLPIAGEKRTALAALLDPEMLVLAAEKAGEDEKSPRATFAQRRSRSLTKQRPIDQETIASYMFCLSASAPKDLEDFGGSLGIKFNHDATSEDLCTSLIADPGKNKSNVDLPNSIKGDFAMDENYNAVFEIVQEKPTVEAGDIRSEETDLVCEDRSGREFPNDKEPCSVKEGGSIAISQSEFDSSEIRIGDEGSEEKSNAVTEDSASEQSDFKHSADIDISDHANRRTESSCGSENCLLTHGRRSQFEVDFEGSIESSNQPDLVTNENHSISSVPDEHAEVAGACVEETSREESQNSSRKVDSEYQQHYLHEINVLEKSIQKYESTLSSGGPLDALRTTYCTKHMLSRITEEINAVQELRLLINSELERMKQLLAERRNMLLTGTARDAVGSAVSQKMADLLREQSSLNIGLSNISDELSIRWKASRRARMYSHIESAKRELKEDKEKCIREFRDEIKDSVVRELSEKFLSEIEELRREVRSKDEIIEKLKKNQDRRELGD